VTSSPRWPRACVPFFCPYHRPSLPLFSPLFSWGCVLSAWFFSSPFPLFPPPVLLLLSRHTKRAPSLSLVPCRLPFLHQACFTHPPSPNLRRTILSPHRAFISGTNSPLGPRPAFLRSHGTSSSPPFSPPLPHVFFPSAVHPFCVCSYVRGLSGGSDQTPKFFKKRSLG